jgi:hypothetical protein
MKFYLERNKVNSKQFQNHIQAIGITHSFSCIFVDSLRSLQKYQAPPSKQVKIRRYQILLNIIKSYLSGFNRVSLELCKLLECYQSQVKSKTSSFSVLFYDELCY